MSSLSTNAMIILHQYLNRQRKKFGQTLNQPSDQLLKKAAECCELDLNDVALQKKLAATGRSSKINSTFYYIDHQTYAKKL